MANVTIDALNEAIEKELTIYSKGLIETIDKEAKSHMKDLVKRTKETAPVGRRTKHYRDSISSKKTTDERGAKSYTWYVKGSDYRLSHLLENGHATRKGGRVQGTKFISKASEPILADYIEKVEEAIKNG